MTGDFCEMKIDLKRLASLLMIIIICVNFIRNIYNQREIFLRKYDHKYLSEIYSNSQYIVGAGSTGIGDDGLYTFAGYYYLSGGDPTQVNFEHPPLGKYLIGISIFLFNNENVIYIFYTLLLFIGIFLLANAILKNYNLALLAVLLVSITRFFQIQYLPVNTQQYSITMLDLPLTLFFIFSLVFFLKGAASVKFYYISSLFLGFAFTTKFFPALILFLPALFLYVFYKDKKNIRAWLISLLFIPGIYLLSYINYFRYNSFFDFINFQKYLISWRLGNPVVYGNIFRSIFLGKYINWWDGQTVVDNEWDWSLALFTFFGLMGVWIAWKKKQMLLEFSGLICIIFLIYLAINSVGVTRYLLPIFPLLVILSIGLLSRKYDKIH